MLYCSFLSPSLCPRHSFLHYACLRVLGALSITSFCGRERLQRDKQINFCSPHSYPHILTHTQRHSECACSGPNCARWQSWRPLRLLHCLIQFQISKIKQQTSCTCSPARQVRQTNRGVKAAKTNGRWHIMHFTRIAGHTESISVFAGNDALPVV